MSESKFENAVMSACVALAMTAIVTIAGIAVAPVLPWWGTLLVAGGSFVIGVLYCIGLYVAAEHNRERWEQ